MTIKNVTIGDKFINPSHRKSKRVSTVIDFLEVKSMTTGEVVRHECIASHEFMGQVLKTDVAFASVVMNRVI
jgi:hypothetical protein